MQDFFLSLKFTMEDNVSMQMARLSMTPGRHQQIYKIKNIIKYTYNLKKTKLKKKM